MEKRADTISAETEKAFDEVIKHLLFLKNQYLTYLKIGLENSIEKIRKKINSLLDAYKCGNYVRSINTLSIPFRIFLDGWDIMFPSTKHMQTVTSHSFFFRLTQNP